MRLFAVVARVALGIPQQIHVVHLIVVALVDPDLVAALLLPCIRLFLSIYYL